jgi:hypothetical protein
MPATFSTTGYLRSLSSWRRSWRFDRVADRSGFMPNVLEEFPIETLSINVDDFPGD